MIEPGKKLSRFKLKSGETAEIRVAQMTDLQMICEMVDDHSSEDGPIDESQKVNIDKEREWLEQSIERMKQRQYLLCYALLDGKAIGECSVVKREHSSSHLGELGLSTILSFRGQGVATALLSAVEKCANKELGIEMMILDVYATNIPALGLYKKLAYKIYGTLPNGFKRDDKYTDKVLMYKELR